MNLLLIAEQDRHGRVACVWYWRPDLPTARPLRRDAATPSGLDTAEFHGAPRDEILAWLNPQPA